MKLLLVLGALLVFNGHQVDKDTIGMVGVHFVVALRPTHFLVYIPTKLCLLQLP